MSGALRDPHYQLPNLSKMDDHDPMTPNTSGKAYSLPILPVMDGPDVTQVWFIRDDVLRPERRDIPRLETEEEQRGETDSAEEVMRRDTEHRLEVGAYDFMVVSLYLVSSPWLKDTLCQNKGLPTPETCLTASVFALLTLTFA